MQVIARNGTLIETETTPLGDLNIYREGKKIGSIPILLEADALQACLRAHLAQVGLEVSDIFINE